MTYLVQAEIADNVAMRNRTAQAVASEGYDGDPDQWVYDNRRAWAAAPGWDAAWASAVAGGILDPGSDEAVITDSMILSQIQTMLP